MNDGDDRPRGGDARTRRREFRYFDFVMAAFVAILLLSNVLGAGKVAQVWPAGDRRLAVRRGHPVLPDLAM